MQHRVALLHLALQLRLPHQQGVAPVAVEVVAALAVVPLRMARRPDFQTALSILVEHLVSLSEPGTFLI